MAEHWRHERAEPVAVGPPRRGMSRSDRMRLERSRRKRRIAIVPTLADRAKRDVAVEPRFVGLVDGGHAAAALVEELLEGGMGADRDDQRRLARDAAGGAHLR